MNPATPCRALAALCLTVVSARAASVSAPSSAWTVLNGNYDYIADQQTGQPESDIVGVGTNAGFFTTFNNNGTASNTDGTIGFRIRLDENGGNKNSPAFTRVAWIGIDANADAVLDVFVGLGMQGSNSVLGIYDAGNSANTSPDTTSISSTAAYNYTVTATNYNYRPVDYLTDGGTTNDVTTSSTGDPDYYLSVLFPFADLVAFLQTQSIIITDETALRYIVATSTQHNSLNQDLGGVDGGINSALTWTQLGGFSPYITASGNLVPEPASAGLAALGLALGTLRRRRK
jgi:MYXO-CTERM domain-containing protein